MHILAILVPITLSYISLTIIALCNSLAPVPLALVLLAITFISLLAIVAHFVAHRILQEVYFAYHDESLYLRTRANEGWAETFNASASNWPSWDATVDNPQQDLVDSVPTPLDWTLTD